MPKRPPSGMKYQNRRTAYDLAARSGEVMRADIAAAGNMSMPTAMKITNYFTVEGILSECGTGDTAMGRKPSLYRFVPDFAYAAAVHCDAAALSCALVDMAGNAAHVSTQPFFGHTCKDYFSAAQAALDTLFEKAADVRGRVVGIGLALPAILEHGQERALRLCPAFGVLDTRSVAREVAALEARYSLPVTLENDVKAAVVGEHCARRLFDTRDMAGIVLGSGVGMAAMLDGKLMRGLRGSAGEIGFFSYDVSYVSDRANYGWLEQQIGLEALRRGFAFTPESPGRSALMHVADILATVITNVVLVLDIDLVVLSGITAEAFGPALTEQVQRRLKRLCILPVTVECGVHPAPGVGGLGFLVGQEHLPELLVRDGAGE